MTKFIFEAIGTHWQIDINDEVTSLREETILADIKNRIEIFDKNYSRFRADSLITEMSKKAGRTAYILPDDAFLLLSFYKKLYDITNGLVTPLIGQVMVDAGYDAEYSLKQKKALEKPKKWEDVLEYSHPTLMLKEPTLLDVGAAGKGYLVDIVGEILKKHNLNSYCIDAGADILHRDAKGKTMTIGLEHPQNLEKVIGTVNISNNSLCASAGNRRVWEHFHHIINPETLVSPKNILATWVVADTTLIADGLSTALFFTPAKTLSKYFTFHYIVLFSDFSIEKSEHFPGEIFVG